MRSSRLAAIKDVPITFRQLMDRYGDKAWKSSPAYLKQCYSMMEDFDELMGCPKLAEINTNFVEAYTEKILPVLAPSTVNKRLAALRGLLKYAYNKEWIEKIPVFPWQREENERIRWLTPEEEKQLLELLPPAVSAFCEILIHTGMRRGELLTLQRDQIDGDYLRLWKTKTKRPRSVPMTDRAKELVNQWVPFNIPPHQIHLAWLKAKKTMGLENDRNFVLHMLRHTAATRVLQSTENIVVVQKLLGHSKITTTMRYAHISDDHLLSAVRQTAKKQELVAVTS
jgi:integrase